MQRASSAVICAQTCEINLNLFSFVKVSLSLISPEMPSNLSSPLRGLKNQFLSLESILHEYLLTTALILRFIKFFQFFFGCEINYSKTPFCCSTVPDTNKIKNLPIIVGSTGHLLSMLPTIYKLIWSSSRCVCDVVSKNAFHFHFISPRVPSRQEIKTYRVIPSKHHS